MTETAASRGRFRSSSPRRATAREAISLRRGEPAAEPAAPIETPPAEARISALPHPWASSTDLSFSFSLARLGRIWRQELPLIRLKLRQKLRPTGVRGLCLPSMLDQLDRVIDDPGLGL